MKRGTIESFFKTPEAKSVKQTPSTIETVVVPDDDFAFYEEALKAAEKLYQTPVSKRGIVAVAKYYPGGDVVKVDGFQSILIHTSAKNLGGDLSPYVLTNEKGHLLENIWQFSKLYPKVTKQQVPISKWQPDKIIWDYPEEVHYENDEILPAYWNWRALGTANAYAVRYPNGFHGRRKCIFSLWPRADDPTQYDKLDYIEARKKIYCGEYFRLAPYTPHFKQLKTMLNNGVNLLIVEVDGPDPDLTYPPYNQISRKNPAMIMNKENVNLLVNDRNKPFGHGFTIATLLLNGQNWL